VSTDPQREPPPVGEEIHLPDNSLIPVLTAVGITVALVGLTTTLLFTIAGGILTLVCIVRWVRDTRRDVSELPLEH
jgi:hypothetical protein